MLTAESKDTCRPFWTSQNLGKREEIHPLITDAFTKYVELIAITDKKR